MLPSAGGARFIHPQPLIPKDALLGGGGRIKEWGGMKPCHRGLQKKKKYIYIYIYISLSLSLSLSLSPFPSLKIAYIYIYIYIYNIWH